jgi:hypothetical protein
VTVLHRTGRAGCPRAQRGDTAVAKWPRLQLYRIIKPYGISDPAGGRAPKQGG